MTNTKQNPILIIGAGLSGLALGQALKQASINFRIFERDQAASFRAQGYRIRIDQRGGDALQRMLPAHRFKQFEDSCAPVIPGGHRVNAITLDELAGGGGMPPQIGNAWNADRTVLRNVLLTNIESHITFDKSFEKYDLTDDGVTVHFTDGSSTSGSLLIGADGVRSRVRKQMLPDHVTLDTEGRAIFGKTPINPNTFATIPETLKQGIYMAIPPSEDRLKLFCDIMTFNQDSLDSLENLTLPQDYIYWVLVFHNSILNDSSKETFHHLNPLESSNLSQTLTEQWHPALQSILMQSDPSASSPLHFSIAKPPFTAWQSDPRVTLMGDAAHPMPPVGGTGANVAFQDARDLFDAVTRSQGGSERGRGLSVEECKAYEEVMRERSEKAVVASAGGAKRFFGMKGVEDLVEVK